MSALWMYQILSRISLLLILLAVTACGQSHQGIKLAPFAERPDKIFVFQYKTEIVQGVVWMFDDEVRQVLYGGPVGIKNNSFTHVVEVKPRFFALPDAQSVLDTEASDVEKLIKAVNLYCEKSGYTRIGTGANIHSTDDSILLVRNCVPAGTEIFADAKAGDDIQRNPLLRAMGVAPLRGKQFLQRYGR